MQYEKVKSFFSDIKSEKWNVAVGGVNEDKPGYFITPTIIDKPDENARIVTEEPFGPIVPLLTWSSEDDVVARANDTRMGLGASVWSNDLSEASRIARRLQAGSVWVNTHIELDPNAPFGGHKDSGMGYEWSSKSFLRPVYDKFLQVPMLTYDLAGGLKAFCNVQTLFLKKTTA